MHLFAGWAPRTLSAGEHWACAAVGLTFALNAFGYMWLFRKMDGIPLRAQLAEMGPPILACAPMVAVVVAIERALAATAPAGLRLVLEVAAGALTFVPSALVLAPGTSREFLSLLGQARRRRGEAEALVS
jgi:hypothetical protein